MRIGTAAEQAGVGVETVRFYEQKGLIDQPAKPKSGGFRQYPVQTVLRIRFVRSAQLLGFSLSEISELLELEAGADTRCVDVRNRAQTKREEVQARIDCLERIKLSLDELIDACPGKGQARRCSILEAINSGELHFDIKNEGNDYDRQDTKN